MKKLISMKKVVLGLLLLTVTLTGCTSGQKVENIVMTYVSSPLNVPSIVEKNQGAFQQAFSDAGYTFEYSNLTTGPEQTQALASGSVQFLNCVGSTSVILAAANGADVKILDMYSRSSKPFTLISNDDSINSPEDMRGKTVGGPVGTVLHELLVAYLASGNMSIDDVNFVNMGIPDALAGLSNGSVDVAMLAGPAAFNAQKEFHLVTTGEGLINSTLVVAVSNDFYQNNKEAIDIFRNVQQDTLAYITNNNDSALQMVADELDLSLNDVKEMYAMYDFNSAITAEDIANMQKTADFMLENGMIDNAVNVQDLIID